MRRLLALLGVVMILSVSADGLVHDHGLDGEHPSCLACQARNVTVPPAVATCTAVPAAPEPVTEVAPWVRVPAQRARYRLAPKTSPPFPVG
jgi:hypothetical protein